MKLSHLIYLTCNTFLKFNLGYSLLEHIRAVMIWTLNKF